MVNYISFSIIKLCYRNATESGKILWALSASTPASNWRGKPISIGQRPPEPMFQWTAHYLLLGANSGSYCYSNQTISKDLESKFELQKKKAKKIGINRVHHTE